MLEIFNFLHFVGLAFGLGGATIASIISAKSDEDKDIAIANAKLMPSISRLIWTGIFLLIISGIALPFYISWPINKQLLIIKHVFVAWIIIIGFFISSKSKKMMFLAPVGRQKPSELFLKNKSQVKSLAKINLFLWYVVTLMSAFV